MATDDPTFTFRLSAEELTDLRRIAAEAQVPVGTLVRHCVTGYATAAARGLEPTPRCRSDWQEEARAIYAETGNYAETARRVGVPASSVRDLLVPRRHYVSSATEVRVREAMHRLKRFTVPELAAEVGLTAQHTRIALRQMAVLRGSVKLPENHVYEFLKPQAPAPGSKPKTKRKGWKQTGAIGSTGITARNRDVRRNIQAAQRQGAQVEHTAGNHYRVIHNGQTVVLAGSPSDARAAANARAQLRRIGLDV